MLKQYLLHRQGFLNRQPPSGGCVLKPRHLEPKKLAPLAATFGWLCVETAYFTKDLMADWQPPSGGCVLKLSRTH